MKKLILVLLLVSSQVFCQNDTSVQVYKGFVTEIEGVKTDFEESKTVVIFHPGGRGEIIVNVNEATVRYFQISNSEKGTDENGDSYQIVECIKENTGKIVILRLYVNKFRIYIQDDYVEFRV